MVAFGALSGGVGAELSGGNFWQGAVTGGIVAGLNHAMHKMGGEDPKPRKRSNVKIQRKNFWDLNGDGILQKNEADRWWLIGNGQEIIVNNGLISWKGVRMPINTPINTNFPLDTHRAFMDIPYETAATYGGTSFKRTGLYTAEVQDQLYHYDLRVGGGFANKIRNIMTLLGQPKTSIDGGRSGSRLQYGKDFMIKYINRTIHFRHDYNTVRNFGAYVAY